MTCPVFADRDGMRASFLETVGVGPPPGVVCYRRPAICKVSLFPLKLSVGPPMVVFVVCPCNQLSQVMAIGEEAN